MPEADILDEAKVDRPITLVAAVLLTCVGTANYMLQPLFLGAAAEYLGYSSAQLGLLAAAELSGALLASLMALFWIRRVDWRLLALVSLLTICGGNLLSVLQSELIPLAGLRFVTALLGQGPVYVLGITLIGDTRLLTRNFSFVVLANVTTGILGMVLLPRLVEDWQGISGILIPTGALAAVALLMVRQVPTRGRIITDHKFPAHAAVVPVLIVLLIQVVWYIGIGAVWAFLELLGSTSGLPLNRVGEALALSTVIGLTGAAVASALQDRLGTRLPFVLGALSQLFALSVIDGAMTWAEMVGMVALFQFGWNLGLPFLMGRIAEFDFSGRLITLLIASQSLGLAIGPAITGWGIEHIGIFTINIVGAVFILVAVIIWLRLRPPQQIASFPDRT